MVVLVVCTYYYCDCTGVIFYMSLYVTSIKHSQQGFGICHLLKYLHRYLLDSRNVLDFIFLDRYHESRLSGHRFDISMYLIWQDALPENEIEKIMIFSFY